MRARIVVGAALALLVASHAAPSRAQEAAAGSHKAAQDAHREGLRLFDKGEHARALAEFRRAYALSPSFRILYNVGLSCVALGDARAAVDAFTSYVRDGGERIPEARRTQVEAEIARLSKQLASLDVQVEEAGAELSVDGEMMGRAPLSRRMRLNAGAHTVVVRSADGTVKTQSITLDAGEERQLHFGAPGRPAPAVAPPRDENPAPAARADSGRRPEVWIGWTVTGTLGLATAITGAVALGARGDERDAKARQGVKAGELADARDKVENLALATDLLLAGTAIAAGVSLYFTLRSDSSSSPQTALVVTPGQLSLRRTF